MDSIKAGNYSVIYGIPPQRLVWETLKYGRNHNEYLDTRNG